MENKGGGRTASLGWGGFVATLLCEFELELSSELMDLSLCLLALFFEN